MAVFERFIFILIGLALIGAAALGVALYYHFSRFSPDRDVTISTIGTYGVGVFAIAIFVFAMMVFN